MYSVKGQSILIYLVLLAVLLAGFYPPAIKTECFYMHEADSRDLPAGSDITASDDSLSSEYREFTEVLFRAGTACQGMATLRRRTSLRLFKTGCQGRMLLYAVLTAAGQNTAFLSIFLTGDIPVFFSHRILVSFIQHKDGKKQSQTRNLL